jgi:hypothetical protein
MRGARHYSELTVWKLADELRVETLKLIKQPSPEGEGFWVD